MIRIFHYNSLSILVYGDNIRTTKSPEDSEGLVIEALKAYVTAMICRHFSVTAWCKRWNISGKKLQFKYYVVAEEVAIARNFGEVHFYKIISLGVFGSVSWRLREREFNCGYFVTEILPNITTQVSGLLLIICNLHKQIVQSRRGEILIRLKYISASLDC